MIVPANIRQDSGTCLEKLMRGRQDRFPEFSATNGYLMIRGENAVAKMLVNFSLSIIKVKRHEHVRLRFAQMVEVVFPDFRNGGRFEFSCHHARLSLWCAELASQSPAWQAVLKLSVTLAWLFLLILSPCFLKSLRQIALAGWIIGIGILLYVVLRIAL